MKMNPRERMYKLAAGIIDLGDPIVAGQGIIEIVNFLLKRISVQQRPKSINTLKYKIWNLNEWELASKKSPATASLGQSITFIKTILMGHSPIFIRSVLREVVRNLHA